MGYADAISSIESGGRYGILGPLTKSGDRAYGKYQVMGNNIPSWTKEILGIEMTPQQFLEDQRAQDAVFEGKFGQYVAKYGNPQDAASMWFTGLPLAKGAGKSDILGTTGADYVAKFTKALGGSPQAIMPDQSAMPAFPWSPMQEKQASPMSSLSALGMGLMSGPQMQAPPQQMAAPPPRRRIDLSAINALAQAPIFGAFPFQRS